MRDDRTEARAERDSLTIVKGKSARFAALVKAAGKPEVYLPLFDPKQDRTFMQAVKQQRVLSIRQEPAARRTDFGIVGFDERKHTTYLVFPKSLKQFADARVIGIKYDVIAGSSLAAGNSPPSSSIAKPKPTKPPHATTSVRPSPPPTHVVAALQPARAKKPETPPKPTPQPEQFRVHVRITVVTDKDLTVTAMTKTDAKKIAKESITEGTVRIVTVTKL